MSHQAAEDQLEICIEQHSVSANGAKIQAADTVPSFHTLFGQPSRIVPAGPPAPYGHRNNHIHYYDAKGLTLNEHHYTYQIHEINIILDPERAILPTSDPFSDELTIEGVRITPGDTASLDGAMERGAHLIVSKLLGPGAAVVASEGIILVLVSSCNAMTLVGPRVNAAMASDGFLPRIFRGQEGKPPTASVAMQGAIAMALMLTHSIKGLIQNVGIMLTLMSALTVLGLVRAKLFRRRKA